MQEETQAVPSHIGFILDGNRRWARERGLSDYKGHAAGYKALTTVIETCFARGTDYISVYAFSNENWKRDKREVAHIMKLVLHAIMTDLGRLVDQQVRVRFLGRRDGLEGTLLTGLQKAERLTQQFTGRTLLVCFNYGGQQEIVDAVRQCMADGLTAQEITEQAIAERLYAPDAPAPDLIVRTSGEQRLSNFMLWRSAYSELLFLEKLWPDMTAEDVDEIIKEYNRRQRRFGA
jgi:undecaprenyl diphosphate synthase